MGAIAFTRNYTDHSNDTGYQFEFHCDKCGSGFRSTFHANVLGVGSKLARGLGSLFGGGSSLWNAAQAGEYMKDGLRGKAWDSAFQEAIGEIKPKFHQCTRCGHWVCPDVCWNEARQMCETCAPDLAEEAAHQQANIAAQQIADKMHKVDLVGDIDVTTQMVGACPHCKARLAAGAKFCAGCGKPVSLQAASAGAAKIFCTGCGTQMMPSSRFCSSCGTQAPA